MSWKYVDIERIGTPENENIFHFPEDEIIVEEKVDGGNGCFYLEGGKLHICSRNRDLEAEQGNEKTFVQSRNWLKENLKGKPIDESCYYYFEHMQKHTINYGNIPPVIGLDIRPKVGAFGRDSVFVSREMKEYMFCQLGIPVVALKGKFKASEINEELTTKLLEKSAYYDGLPEGIVFKNYGRMNRWNRQLFGKVVREEFREMNKATFGGIKRDMSDTIKFVDTFCTDARIRKRILSLVNQDRHKLERSLMKYLAISVVEDMLKEEYGYITRLKELNIDTLKKMVAGRCLMTLDTMIVEAQEDEIRQIAGKN